MLQTPNPIGRSVLYDTSTSDWPSKFTHAGSTCSETISSKSLATAGKSAPVSTAS